MSSHSSREQGVCQDELRIALCEKGAYIQPILLENMNSFSIPQNIVERQWIDMSDWHSYDINSESFETYYKERFNEILKVLNSNNQILLEATSPKQYQSVIISIDEFEMSSTYEIIVGSQTYSTTLSKIGTALGTNSSGGGNQGGGRPPRPF